MTDAPNMTVLLVAAGWMFAHTLAWGLLGRFLALMLQTRGFLSPLNAHLRVFFYLALGVSGHLFVLFIAGATGFFDPIWVSLTLVPLSVIGFKGVWASLRFRAFSQVALALFALGYVLQFAIRAPGYWDDTSFHLPIARFYLEQGHFAVAEFLRFPLCPQHMNLLIAQGLSLQGELLAQMLATWPLWLMLLGLYGAALHWLESQLAAFLACVLPFFLLPITATLGYAYTDLGLSALAFAGALTLMLATQAQGGRRVLLMAGLLLGTAASMKLFGLIWSVGWLALCSAHPVLRRGAGWVVLGMVLTGSFWYLRAFWLSGDPFHPLLGDIVGHYLWSAEDLRGQKAEQASHGVSTSLLPFWEAFSKAGVLWLLPALVAGLFLLRRDRGLGIGWLAFLGYALFWLKVGQVERYLAPALGLGCLLAVVCLWRFGLARALERFYWRLDRLFDRARRSFGVRPLGWSHRAGVIAALQIVVLLPPTRADWIDAPARLEAWPQWLVGRKGYSLFEAANQVSLAAPNPALVQVGFENGVYFFKGRSVGDWFGLGRYSQFIVCTDRCRMGSPQSVAQRVDAFNASLLMVNTQRFAIEIDGYLPWFEVVSATPEGVLLSRRRDGETPQ